MPALPHNRDRRRDANTFVPRVSFPSSYEVQLRASAMCSARDNLAAAPDDRDAVGVLLPGDAAAEHGRVARGPRPRVLRVPADSVSAVHIQGLAGLNPPEIPSHTPDLNNLLLSALKFAGLWQLCRRAGVTGRRSRAAARRAPAGTPGTRPTAAPRRRPAQCGPPSTRTPCGPPPGPAAPSPRLPARPGSGRAEVEFEIKVFK